MQYPYYEFSVPVFAKMLRSVSHLLDIAHEFVQSKGGDEQLILNASIAPDMFPFVKQVRICTDNAKGAAARLARVEVPVYEDTEQSIADLKVRVEKTIQFIESLKPEQFADAASVRVELPYFQGMHFEGDGYLRQYAIPNFFFHVATTYNILRAQGASLGKADYMHGLPLIPNA